jgi:NAD(P)-dependent dehydrogenase (short-subunit alcohol dehydrogenase family)
VHNSEGGLAFPYTLNLVAAVKVAVITGAGSGIGLAVALALAREGYSMVLGGRRLERLGRAAKRCRALGGDAVPIQVDVSNPEAVAALFEKVRRQCGRLALLINNAGQNAPPMPLEDLPISTWQALIDTNLTGAFLCTQEAFRLMKQQVPRGGRITNNGSISAHVPRPLSAAYTASKHALTG